MTTDNEIIAARLAQMVETDEERASKTRDDRQPYSASWLMGPGTTPAGVHVNETTALSISAVFACVRNLAEDEAKLPCITYRKLKPTGKERLLAHPVYRLLHDDPNPEMSAFDFRQAVTASAVLYGNGYAEIERTNLGIPLALWPIEPWRVCARRDPSRQLYYDVDGGKTRLTTTDMLHIKGFGTDGVLGLMCTQIGRDSFGLTIAAQRFAASFFGNGMRLSGVLSHPKTLSDAAERHLRESVERVHVGDGKQHRFAIFEEGMTWTQTSSDPDEAQMLETRQFQVEDVARWFRMPPHKIQHLLRSTFSNIEHQSIEYVVDTLMPWLVRWEQESKRKLIEKSEPEVFVEHLVDGMLRGDITSRYAAYAVARQNGWLNGDEIRDKENMNPMPDGDKYLVNGTMIPISTAIAPPIAPKPEIAPTDATPPFQKVVADKNQRSLDALPTAIAEAHRPALLDAAARAARREVEVIRRKSKKPDGLTAAITEFYAGHEDYVRNSIRPAVTAYMGTLEMLGHPHEGIAECVERCASAYVTQATAEMLASAQDSERLEHTLTEWESQRSQAIVNEIMRKP
jgi:HK97 family phage portal protein